MSPCLQLLSICLPTELFGERRRFEILFELISKSSEPIPSLEKLAILRLLQAAMTDSVKREALVSSIIQSNPVSLVPLIFGDCLPLSKFIVEHIPVHFSATYILLDRNALIVISQNKITLAFGGEHIVVERRGNEERIFDLLPTIFQKQVIRVTFIIDNRISSMDEMIARVIKVWSDSDGRMNEMGLMTTENDIMVCFKKSE